MSTLTIKYRRPLVFSGLWLAIGWLLIATVAYLSLTPSPPEVDLLPYDKLRHGFTYACLMFWFGSVYLPAGHPWLAVSLIVFGIALEILQGMGGVRHFEFFDMLANATGVLMGWLLCRSALGTLLLKLEGFLGAERFN